jgi:protoheme IX farnesyltransferase
MKSNTGDKISYYLKLSKLRIMIPVSLTGFTGYFIYKPQLSLNILLVTTGILLLAISASALNQIQEVDIDSRMNRTQGRPLPSGKISVQNALIFFFCTLVSGSVILYSSSGLIALLTGLLTIIWYNGIYTYTKRFTAFAVVPGALTGALPPLIGWVAAGGGIWERPIIFLEFLFFTGQIPHFWLLILQYGEEYSKAGIRSLTDILSRSQINRLTFTWVVTSVIAALFLCFFEIIRNVPLCVILLFASVYIVWKFSDLISGLREKGTYRHYFILLDAYFLLLLILLISDRIIN